MEQQQEMMRATKENQEKLFMVMARMVDGPTARAMSEAMVSDAPAELAAPALEASQGGVALGAGSSMKPGALEASGSGGAMD
eukprot:6311398-Karenia_brevis.AAC.1